MISSFFIYTDKNNALAGRPKRVNSVNLGFLYVEKRKRFAFRMTYTKNGKQGKIKDFYPKFDMSKGFNNYGFKFTSNGIVWFLNGKRMFAVSSKVKGGTPKLFDGPYRIFLNTWVVKDNAGFGGKFRFAKAVSTKFDAVRFERGSNCKFR